MTIVKLVRSCHGRSAWAMYEMKGYRMDVYVRHNVACKKDYDSGVTVSCYVKPKNEDLSMRQRAEFTDYAAFIEFRKMITYSLN